MYSVFKVKEKNRRLYFYFQSIEELHEMYIWILKKYPKLLKEKKLEILKETKDKRVSRISGKYYKDLPDNIKIEEWNILKVSLPKEKLEISSMRISDYYYTSRKEFDHKKDGFSCINIDFSPDYNAGMLGIRECLYKIMTEKCKHDDYSNISGNRLDIDCNSLEELHDIYLYFLKLGYHTKIISSNTDPKFIKRKKWKTTQKAKWLRERFPFFTVTIMVCNNWNWFIKLWESIELLYPTLDYTFRRSPTDSGNNLRFSMKDFKRLIINKKLNYGDII